MQEVDIAQVGLDLGNSIIKAVAGVRQNGRDWVEIPTIVLRDAEGVQRSEESRLGLLDSLDLTLDSPVLSAGATSGLGAATPATRWRVGGSVIRDRRRGDRAVVPPKGAVKTESLPILVTGLTALAVLGIGRVTEARLRRDGALTVRIGVLGASLPYNQHNAHKATLRRLLRGHHILRFSDLPRIGSLEVHLHVGVVQTLPEGMPAVLSYAYTLSRDGYVVTMPSRSQLLSQPLGVLDVGGGTTDVILFDLVDGRWSLDDTASVTLNFGVNDALTTAVERLQQDGWSRFQNVGTLVRAIRAGETVLRDMRDGTGEINLMDYVANEDLRMLGERVSEVLRDRWHKEIASFLLAGGGAMILYRSGYLAMPWKRQPELLPNAEWANAVGNLLFAVRYAQRGQQR